MEQNIPRDIIGIIDSYVNNKQWKIVNKEELVQLVQIPKRGVNYPNCKDLYLVYYYNSVHCHFNFHIHPDYGKHNNIINFDTFKNLLLFEEVYNDSNSESIEQYFKKFCQKFNYKFDEFYHGNFENTIIAFSEIHNGMFLDYEERELDCCLSLRFINNKFPLLFLTSGCIDMHIPRFLYPGLIEYINLLK